MNLRHRSIFVYHFYPDGASMRTGTGRDAAGRSPESVISKSRRIRRTIPEDEDKTDKTICQYKRPLIRVII